LEQKKMARQSKDWNEGLAKDLQDLEFARELLLASIEEGISVQVALGKVIRAIGIKEFSKKSKIASPNIIRAINSRHNPTQETLNRLLKPFGLMLAVAPLQEIQKKPSKEKLRTTQKLNRAKKFKAALEKANRKFSKTLKSLANS
jgi:DNA-binding phage protein